MAIWESVMSARNACQIELTNSERETLERGRKIARGLGLINVEQNNIFKVLTIVSVIGIPPPSSRACTALISRTYRNNDRAWGYQWACSSSW